MPSTIFKGSPESSGAPEFGYNLIIDKVKIIPINIDNTNEYLIIYLKK